MQNVEDIFSDPSRKLNRDETSLSMFRIQREN